jgi:hypothetical protein
MAEHEPCIGGSDEWYTPREIFTALGLTFDLDPCSPGAGHWVPARKVYTIADDGLAQAWNGLVFMNPPFGGRHGHVPWLVRFFDHMRGIAVVRSYTSSDWWHAHMPRAEAILFPRGKTRFVPSEETRARLEREAKQRDPENGKFNNAPGHGVVLIGMGDTACEALHASNLGMVWDRRIGQGLALTPAERPDVEKIGEGQS